MTRNPMDRSIQRGNADQGPSELPSSAEDVADSDSDRPVELTVLSQTTSSDRQDIPCYSFEALSHEQRQIRIRLGHEVYILRRTQADKLLLNK